MFPADMVAVSGSCYFLHLLKDTMQDQIGDGEDCHSGNGSGMWQLVVTRYLLKDAVEDLMAGMLKKIVPAEMVVVSGGY